MRTEILKFILSSFIEVPVSTVCKLTPHQVKYNFTNWSDDVFRWRRSK